MDSSRLNFTYPVSIARIIKREFILIFSRYATLARYGQGYLLFATSNMTIQFSLFVRVCEKVGCDIKES